MNDQTQKYQTEMKVSYRQKRHIILYCTKAMRDEELEAESKSIELIRSFESVKKHKFRDLEDADDKDL